MPIIRRHGHRPPRISQANMLSTQAMYDVGITLCASAS